MLGACSYRHLAVYIHVTQAHSQASEFDCDALLNSCTGLAAYEASRHTVAADASSTPPEEYSPTSKMGLQMDKAPEAVEPISRV
jgi:hypothetical protein